MTTARWCLLVAVLIGGNVVFAVIALTRKPAAVAPPRAVEKAVASPRLDELESAVERLARAVHALDAARRSDSQSDGTRAAERTLAPDAVDALGQRVDSLEQALGDLRAEVAAIGDSAIAQAAQADFAADDGFVHADRLSEAGKHSLAAEGYIEFLENNAEHPDFHDIAHRARRELLRAGYVDRALDLQKALIERYPEYQEQNYSTLAMMEKNAGRYGDAIEHLTESINRTTHTETRLWRLMYRAWYIQLRDGDAAGLTAYRDVDRTRQELGVTTGKIPGKIAEKIEQIEKRLAGR